MRIGIGLLVVALVVMFGFACKKSAPGQSMNIAQVQFSANETAYSYRDTESIGGTIFPWLALQSNSPGARPDSVFLLCTIGFDKDGNRAVMNLLVNPPSADPLLPGIYSLPPPTSVTDTSLIRTTGALEYTFTNRTYRYLVSDTVTVSNVENGFAAGTFSATFALAPGSPDVVHISNGDFKGVQVQYYIGRIPGP